MAQGDVRTLRRYDRRTNEHFDLRLVETADGDYVMAQMTMAEPSSSFTVNAAPGTAATIAEGGGLVDGVVSEVAGVLQDDGSPIWLLAPNVPNIFSHPLPFAGALTVVTALAGTVIAQVRP